MSCIIQVVREFKRPENMTDKQIDAAGDGKMLHNM